MEPSGPKISVDTSAEKGLSKALQGQEVPTLKDMLTLNNDSEMVEIPSVRSAFQSNDHMNMSSSPRVIDLVSDSRAMNSNFRVVPRFFHQNDVAETLKKRSFNNEESKMSPLSMMHSSNSLSIMGAGMRVPLDIERKQQSQMYFRCSPFTGYDRVHGLESMQQQHPGGWLYPLLPSSAVESSTMLDKSNGQQSPNTSISGGNCKIFGISLNSKSMTTVDPPGQQFDPNNQDSSHLHYSESNLQSTLNVGSEQHAVPSGEPGKGFESLEQLSRDVHAKQHTVSTRSCVKVLKFIHIQNYS